MGKIIFSIGTNKKKFPSLMNKLIQLRILSKKLGGSFFCLSENRSQCSHNSFFVVPTFLHSLFPVYDTSTPKVTDHILPHAVLNTHVH